MTAPLHFTQAYHSPEELDAAWEQWVEAHRRLNAYAESNMWHRNIVMDGAVETAEGHRLEMFTADLRPPPPAWHPDDALRRPYRGPGVLLYQAVCAPCRWHHIAAGENPAVEAWHDHAVPGWRELPVVPLETAEYTATGQPSKRLAAWLDAHYPAEAQQPGHPVRTERRKHGGRHVPGRSPWGGYDLAVLRAETRPLEPPPPPTGLPAAVEQITLF